MVQIQPCPLFMKICFNCKISKEESEFRKRGEGLQGTCKTCKKEYDRKFHKRRSIKALERKNELVKNRHKKLRDKIWVIKSDSCTDCKYRFHPFCMDFDHLENKEINIADMLSLNYSLKKVLEEIKKCDLVCANCHRLRTWNRLNSGM